MSSNPQNGPEIAALLQSNEVGSLQSLGQALTMKGLDLNSRGKAQPKTEAVLEANGFVWDEEKSVYRSDRGYQSVVAFPQRIYIWSYASLGKFLPNTAALATWLAGSNQEFLTKLMQLTGEADPVDVGTAIDRPAPLTQDQEIDAIISKIKPGMRMKADNIIDLYKKAKETSSEKLMALVKTLQVQESIKKSDLRKVIEEIVNTIIKEAPFKGESSDDYFKRLDATGNSPRADYNSPQQNPTERWVEDFANKMWKDPQDIGKGGSNLKWKISKAKKAETGETVYLLKKTKTIDLSRFIIKRGNDWYYLDPDTKKWIVMPEKPPVAEMTTTAAVGPIQTPMAFSKKDEEQLDEMNTTDSGTPGYMIPGAFSRKGGSKKGVEGSAALGYTLTPIGKKEMEKTGDRLT